MMQMRDWVIGFIGLTIGALGILSLINVLPFELSRTLMIWVAALGGIILLYASIVEITNSNIMGTVSLIAAGVLSVISLLPLFNSFGWFGSWAEFKWLGDAIYKIALSIGGAFLMIATFAMEL